MKSSHHLLVAAGVFIALFLTFLFTASSALAAEVSGEHAGAYVGALGNSKPVALVFWLFSILTVAGSIFVITRSNTISAVMGMVGTFFCISGLYAMLYGHFLAVIQILVYAGAIMVLFVFVIMILNKPEEERWSVSSLWGKGLVAVSILYLLVRVGQVLWAVKDTAAAQVSALPASGVGSATDFGSTKALASVLFGQYLFPFEAVSIVLLIAVVGAIAVARPSVLAHAQGEGENLD